MVTKLMEWVSITALLLAITWGPLASYQMQLDFVVSYKDWSNANTHPRASTAAEQFATIDPEEIASAYPI
jgi:hypothetical protein